MITVSDVTAKVSTHDTMPCGPELLVKLNQRQHQVCIVGWRNQTSFLTYAAISCQSISMNFKHQVPFQLYVSPSLLVL